MSSTAKAQTKTPKKTTVSKSDSKLTGISQINKGNLHLAVKDNFGFEGFKGTQEKVIESLLAGHDTFVIMPTGGGKSLCYQLPRLRL